MYPADIMDLMFNRLSAQRGPLWLRTGCRIPADVLCLLLRDRHPLARAVFPGPRLLYQRTEYLCQFI
jgi:hypothetical protein